jgi:hypothetical protein
VTETEHLLRRFADAARRRELRATETKRTRELRAALGKGWHV